MRRLAILAAVVLVLAAPALAQSTTWNIDPAHTSAQFSVRHMMVTNVRGQFTKVSGVVNIDDKDITRSTVEVTIDATSIDTQNDRRDNHLKSADFFDVATFPTITFKSKSVAAAGAGRLKVTGDLTIRGVTREVTLDVEGPTPPINAGRAIKRGASATTKINRQDFGVKWNNPLEGGGVVVGDEVSITIDVELNKAQAQAPPAQ
jgi:polyisoprenoid-binding protein YceI